MFKIVELSSLEDLKVSLNKQIEANDKSTERLNDHALVAPELLAAARDKKNIEIDVEKLDIWHVGIAAAQILLQSGLWGFSDE